MELIEPSPGHDSQLSEDMPHIQTIDQCSH